MKLTLGISEPLRISKDDAGENNTPEHNFLKVGTLLGCILSIFLLSHIFPHIVNVLALKQTDLSTIELFRWSSSILNPESAGEIIRLEESGTMNLDNSV